MSLFIIDKTTKEPLLLVDIRSYNDTKVDFSVVNGAWNGSYFYETNMLYVNYTGDTHYDVQLVYIDDCDGAVEYHELFDSFGTGCITHYIELNNRIDVLDYLNVCARIDYDDSIPF